jgi:hypothetical protein
MGMLWLAGLALWPFSIAASTVVIRWGLVEGVGILE